MSENEAIEENEVAVIDFTVHTPCGVFTLTYTDGVISKSGVKEAIDYFDTIIPIAGIYGAGGMAVSENPSLEDIVFIDGVMGIHIEENPSLDYDGFITSLNQIGKETYGVGAVFDDSANIEQKLSAFERVTTAKKLVDAITSLKGGDFSGAKIIEKVKIVGEISRLVSILTGADADQNKEAQAGDFEYDGDGITARVRQKRNNDAVALLKRIESGVVVKPLTQEQRKVLSLYSGNGGGLVREGGKSGSQYEYYTPKPIASAMWELLKESGFIGGAVLDPCAGTGIFSETKPADGVAIHSVELDAVSGGINKALFDDGVNTVDVSNYEKIAAATDDEVYDAVVTNVPFGDNKARGKSKSDDPRYQNESLDAYFILRSLDKLKPNGLAVFMSSTRFISGFNHEKARIAASMKAEFMGAYRLPNKLFESAGADVVTDVMVFKKHSRDARERIDELKQTAPDMLRKTGVIFDEFVNGKYFSGEGLAFKIGDSTTKLNRFGKEVEALVSDASVADIAKSLRRFGGSRINWELLNAQVGENITYAQGDVTVVNGQTLVFDGVNFNKVEQADGGADNALIDGMGEYVSALYVFENKVKYDRIVDGFAACQAVKSYKTVPTWLYKVIQGVNDKGFGALEFNKIVLMTAYYEAIQAHSMDVGFNFVEAYPVTSEAIKCSTKAAFKSPLEAVYLAEVREAFKSMHVNVVDRKLGEYSKFWRGESQTEVVIDSSGFTPLQNYERLLYRNGASQMAGVPIGDFAEAMPNVDVLTSDDWMYSTDGKFIIHKDDYYTGTFEEFNASNQNEVPADTHPAIKAKIAQQLSKAKEKLTKVDVTKIDFDIRSPYIEKAQLHSFLKQFFDADIRMDESGKFKYGGTKDSKFAKGSMNAIVAARLVDYINRGVFSSQVSTEKDAELDAEIRRHLAEAINKSNLQFNAYMRSNSAFMRDIDGRINTPKTMRFPDADGAGKLNIEGMSDKITPHEYQSDYVRQQARHMGGILAYDVGLGKTLTALATVKHLQNIGAKKKTIFVVPNTVLTNWRKEVNQAYNDTSDCLFVGMREDMNGKPSVKSSEFAADLTMLRDNKYRKIFMTLEAFEKIPMTEDTLDEYIERYLPTVEDVFSLAGVTDKEQLSAESAQLKIRKDITSKMDASVPFIESMGIDSIVVDEAHVFKNSRQGSIDSSGSIQFLSLPATSSRGTNAQIKTWYIRGQNMPKADGVLLLTATPVTNSPLEIYSMLILTHGESRLQDMLGGIKNSSGFLQAFCNIESKEFENIHNETVEKQAFVGLKNAVLLRKIFGDIAKVKTAQDEDVASLVNLPDHQEFNQNIEMPDDIKKILADSVEENKKAKAAVDGSKKTGTAPDKEDALKSSAFYFINRVSRAVIDKDMYDEVTRYGVSDLKNAKSVIDAFNAKLFKEERTRPSPYTPSAAVLDVKNVKAKKGEDGEDKEIFIIHVTAWLDGNTIVIDTDEYEMQAKFLAIAEKAGLNLTVSLSPKMAALIANVSTERANPKAHGGKCKQVIFCDYLGMHKKIKMALVQNCGIDASKISIVNAVEVNDAGLLQDIQDGFNAEGEDNVFEIIIANKKAEVGINLQKGSQALHHLTTGWTPDSGQQRNGRVLRQGNYVDSVAIYHYHANGTFDEYKKQLVTTKGDWISDLLSGTGDKVAIEGQLSKDDMDVLAGFVGNDEAMAKARQNMEAQKRQSDKKAVFRGIESALQVYEVSMKESANYSEFEKYVASRAYEAFKSMKEVEKITQRLSELESKENKEEAPINRLKARLQSADFLFKKQSDPIVEALGGEFDPTKIGIFMSYDGKDIKVNSASITYNYKARLYSEEIKSTQMYVEWSDMMNSHTGIMTESIEKSIAAGAAQGVSESIVRGYFNGDFIRAGDGFCGAGSIVKTEGTDNNKPIYAAVISILNKKDIVAAVISDEFKKMSSAVSNVIVLNEGSSEYNDVINVAIGLENTRLEAVGWKSSRDDELCRLLPKVAQGLKKPIASKFSSNQFAAMDCEYPWILLKGSFDTPLLRAIKAVQAEKGVEYVGRFDEAYSSDFGALKDDVQFSYPDALYDMLTFAMARSLPVGVADIDSIKGYRTNALNKEECFKLFMIGLTSISDIDSWLKLNKDSFNSCATISDAFIVLFIEVLKNAGVVEPKLLLNVLRFFDSDVTDNCPQNVLQKLSSLLNLSIAPKQADGDVVYVVTSGSTYGAFTSFKDSVPTVCDIRALAKKVGRDICFVDKMGESKNDRLVLERARKTGRITVTNSWVMDKRVWDAVVEGYKDNLNRAGITAHEVK